MDVDVTWSWDRFRNVAIAGVITAAAGWMGYGLSSVSAGTGWASSPNDAVAWTVPFWAPTVISKSMFVRATALGLGLGVLFAGNEPKKSKPKKKRQQKR